MKTGKGTQKKKRRAPQKNIINFITPVL